MTLPPSAGEVASSSGDERVARMRSLLPPVQRPAELNSLIGHRRQARQRFQSEDRDETLARIDRRLADLKAQLAETETMRAALLDDPGVP